MGINTATFQFSKDTRAVLPTDAAVPRALHLHLCSTFIQLKKLQLTESPELLCTTCSSSLVLQSTTAPLP
ncbi:hypothetical protein M0R45_007970 [Rubus argutus]|uniref:Uncharacterized protein n=1 Tax=Rubus argutus TaxID=59490 RepID=A0AAW1XZU2_RUBAR